MPRRARSAPAGLVYHVLNRANGGMKLFHKAGDYAAFEKVLGEVSQLFPGVELFAYCLMPTHFHLVLRPGADGELSNFMRRLTVTHAQRYCAHSHSAGTGHVYQGRFKSFPVREDGYLLTLLRYVERNPLRAKQVDRAERWHWSSLWRSSGGVSVTPLTLAAWPIPRPPDWVDRVNQPQTAAEAAAVSESIARSRPLGDPRWVQRIAARLELEWTLRRAAGRV